MDSFELNKIIGAILGTLLFVMGVGFIAEAIYEPAHDGGPGYGLPEPTETEGGPTTEAPKQVADIGTLLAAADPKAGESAAKKCAACHDFTEGGPNKTGPNLYGIVGEKIADVEGFSFSEALKAHASDTWTYDKLNEWLTSPKAFAPGTKMTYAGDKDDKDRANIIAFLSTLSHSPVPFPPPAAPAGGQAPTGEQTTAGSSSAAPGTAVETPATTDTGGTNSPGTGTATETPAGASSQPPQTTAASSAEIPAVPASSAPASEPASSSAAQ
jgi:cytochrome c